MKEFISVHDISWYISRVVLTGLTC